MKGIDHRAITDRQRPQLVALLLFALSLLAPALASAQLSLGGGANHIAARLVAESDAPAPGSHVDLAIAMTPESGWHGYWLNGGDAGFGMEIRWTLPPGVSIGELRYPVPQTLIIAGLMNHVYEQPYALIAPVSIAANVTPGTRLPIVGEASWLACTNEVCVPERGRLSIELVAGNGAIAAPARAEFDRWRAALPQPLGGAAHYQATGGTIRFAIPWPHDAAVEAPHLFVATPRIVEPAAPQSFARDGDRLIVSTRAGSDAATHAPIEALLRFGDGRGVIVRADAGTVAAAGEPLTDTATATGFSAMTFWAALAGAILGGLILNIMPCVFPILSLKALTIARGGGDERHVRAEGVAYTAGAVFVCLALGLALLLLRAGGEAVGWAFQLQSPPSVMLLIVLIAGITANLAGLFDFGQIGVGQRFAAAGGTRGAFATGALAAFIATPCSGPFLGAALGATLALPAWAALPIFGGLGLGLALPFLALAFLPALRRRLPKPGPWMESLRRWLALPMLATLIALVWLLGRQVGPIGWVVGAVAAVLVLLFGGWAGRRQRAGQDARAPLFLMAALIVPAAMLLPPPAPHAATRATDRLASEPWSAERLATQRAEHRPVFVYFTADWCLSCKVNEAAAIDRADTAAAFARAHVATLVADWTNADPAITRELAAHGRNSVPLYLFYPADGGAPRILPQILTPGLLAAEAAR